MNNELTYDPSNFLHLPERIDTLEVSNELRNRKIEEGNYYCFFNTQEQLAQIAYLDHNIFKFLPVTVNENRECRLKGMKITVDSDGKIVHRGKIHENFTDYVRERTKSTSSLKTILEDSFDISLYDVDTDVQGMGLFLDPSNSDEGSVTNQVINCYREHIPFITSPHLIKTAINNGEIPLQNGQIEGYHLYRTVDNSYFAALPSNVSPDTMGLENLILVTSKELSDEKYEETLKSVQNADYHSLRSIFNPNAAKKKMSFVLAGHGESSSVANLKDAQYADLLSHLDHCYNIPICYVISCQPRGNEPRMKNILVRRGLPNLNTTSGSNNQYRQFFREASKLNLHASWKDQEGILERTLSYVKADEEPSSRSVLWRSTPVEVRGGRLHTSDPEIMALDLISVRKQQLKKENLIVPSNIKEIHILPTTIPLDLEFTGEPPTIYSHIPIRGAHFISSINAPKVERIEDLINKSFAHRKKHGLDESTTAYASHLYFIKKISISGKTFNDVFLWVNPVDVPTFYYKSVQTHEPMQTSTSEGNVLVQQLPDHAFFSGALQLIDWAIPSKKALKEVSAGQEDYNAFFEKIQEEFFPEKEWVGSLSRPRTLQKVLLSQEKLDPVDLHVIKRYIIDHDYLDVTHADAIQFERVQEYGRIYFEANVPGIGKIRIDGMEKGVLLDRGILNSKDLSHEHQAQFKILYDERDKKYRCHQPHVFLNLLLSRIPKQYLIPDLSPPQNMLKALQDPDKYALKLYLTYNPEAIDDTFIIASGKETTLLTLAVETLDIKLLIWLLRHGANPENVKTKLLNLIKSSLVLEGPGESVQKIIELLPIKNLDEQEMVLFSEIVALSAEKNASLSVFQGYIDIIKAQKQKVSQQVFEAAIKRGNVDLLELLKKNHLLPQTTDNILNLIVANPSFEIFAFLFNHDFIQDYPSLLKQIFAHDFDHWLTHIISRKKDLTPFLSESRSVTYKQIRELAFKKDSLELYEILQKRGFITSEAENEDRMDFLFAEMCHAVASESPQILSHLLTSYMKEDRTKEKMKHFEESLFEASLNSPKPLVTLIQNQFQCSPKVRQQLQERVFSEDSPTLYRLLCRNGFWDFPKKTEEELSFFVESMLTSLKHSNVFLLSTFLEQFEKWRFVSQKENDNEIQQWVEDFLNIAFDKNNPEVTRVCLDFTKRSGMALSAEQVKDIKKTAFSSDHQYIYRFLLENNLLGIPKKIESLKELESFYDQIDQAEEHSCRNIIKYLYKQLNLKMAPNLIPYAIEKHSSILIKALNHFPSFTALAKIDFPINEQTLQQLLTMAFNPNNSLSIQDWCLSTFLQRKSKEVFSIFKNLLDPENNANPYGALMKKMNKQARRHCISVCLIAGEMNPDFSMNSTLKSNLKQILDDLNQELVTIPKRTKEWGYLTRLQKRLSKQ